MSFVNVFGGTTIYPADVAYRALALTANTTLEWPTELASSANILASIMDVTPAGGTHTIRLPAANLASVGETALFFNVGAVNFIIADNGGNTLVTVAPGLAWQVYLTNNVTANGVWRSTQYGAGTSSATAGSLVGAGIKAIGTTLNQSMPSSSLNTNYVVGVGDRAQVLNWTGGAGTFTLPSAATAGADWFFNVRNSGTGSVTISPSVGGQFINGGASLVMNPGDSAVIFCDGAGFFTVGLGKSAAFAFDFVSIDLTAQSSPYTLSGANLNRIAYRFTGTITGNMDVIVPATVQQYWFANETSLASAPYMITLKTAAGSGVNLSRNQRAIVYCDGTNVVDADTGGISIPLTIAQGGTGATTESGARINLGGTSTGIAVFTAASASSARNSLGSGATGDAIFVAANTAAAQAALGTITVPNGGTGATTLTGVVKGNGISAFTAGTVSLTSEVSGTLPVVSGGTGVTTSTGTVAVVLSNSPTLVTPNLGTPSVVTLTNATGLPLTTGVTGTLAATNGGTGQSSYAVGDILFASTTTALSKLADVATGNALISGGVGVAPSYGKIGLTTHVSDTLPVANGGTGQTTYTNGQLLIGNTTGNTLTKATLTAGSGVSITNGAGSITIAATGSGGTVTSVDASGGTTGMTFSGGPIITSGTLTLAGTLAVANGGTGVTTSTGTGSVVLSNSPVLVTPTLGAASATSIANALGSAAAPSYTFTGDTNTGMFSPGADTIAFSEGGVEAMRITSAGNVGIGETAPGARLHVSGGTVGTTAGNLLNVTIDQGIAGGNAVGIRTNLVRVSSGTDWTTTAMRLQGRVDATDFGYIDLVSGGAQGLAFGSSTSERMRIDSSGNVMVGTTSATGLFSVNGLSYGQMIATDRFGLLGNNLYFGTGNFRYIGNGHAYAWAQGNTDGADYRLLYAGNNTSGGGAVATPTERLYITAAGNVGIGTTSPGAKLDVVGVSLTRTDSSGGSTPLIVRNDSSANNTTKSTGLLFQGVDTVGTGKNTGVVQCGPSDANYVTSFLAFQTRTADALNERMRIDSAGNLLVGSASSPSGSGTNLQVSNAGSARMWLTSTGNRNFYLESGSAAALQFVDGTAAAERMRIDSAGNVGIGTSSPGYRLDIAAGDTSAGLGYAMRIRSNATAAAATIQFTNSAVSTQNGLIACTDTGGMTIQTDGASSVLAFRTNGNERFRILSTGGITSSDLADAVGYKGVPQNAQTATYTLALSDMGKHISITTGGVVIPANGSVAFPVGSTIVIYNNSGTAQNISITTDTLRLAGTATTGIRSLAQRGLATCVKVASTEWVVTGNVT